jgi:hypothetical protein
MVAHAAESQPAKPTHGSTASMLLDKHKKALLLTQQGLFFLPLHLYIFI